MTHFAVDAQRWYAGETDDDAPGSVPIAPPEGEWNAPVVGDPWPRWFRFMWTIEPYGLVPVPKVVAMKQARKALLLAGRLQDVQPAIDGMPSPDKEAAQIEWDYSSTVERNNPVMLRLAEEIGLTEPDIDQLFIVAATL